MGDLACPLIIVYINNNPKIHNLDLITALSHRYNLHRNQKRRRIAQESYQLYENTLYLQGVSWEKKMCLIQDILKGSYQRDLTIFTGDFVNKLIAKVSTKMNSLELTKNHVASAMIHSKQTMRHQ